MAQVNRKRLAVAAFLFSQGQRVVEIAKAVGVSEGTIYRWAKRPEWKTELDELGWTGSRDFQQHAKRDVKREFGTLIESSFNLYQQHRADGEPHHRALTRTAETQNLKRKRVAQWARRFNWKETNQ